MPKANFDQIDVRIDSHTQQSPPSNELTDYIWPCDFWNDSENVNPLISPNRAYKWHSVSLQEIPAIVGLVASHPEIDGRCMVFNVEPACNDMSSSDAENFELADRANFTFIRYEYLIPSLSILSGSELVGELMRHLKYDPLAIYCSARGFFWMRKQIQDLW